MHARGLSLIVVFVTACGPAAVQPSDTGEASGSDTSTDDSESSSETGLEPECPIVEPLPDPGPCIEQRASFGIDGWRPQAGTLGGWVLLSDLGDILQLQRVGVDDSIDTTVQLQGSANGSLVPAGGGHLWVLQSPDTLLELDANGTLLSSVELGAPMSESGGGLSLLNVEGDLIRNYLITDFPYAQMLERRSPLGELRWARPLIELLPYGRPANFVDGLGVRDGVLTMLVYAYGTDSASVSLMGFDPADGTTLWEFPLVGDDFLGPYFSLAGHDESVIVKTPGENVDINNPEPMQIFAVDSSGAMTWTLDVLLPELPVMAGSSVAALGDDLLVSVLGFGDGESRSTIVRVIGKGESTCALPFITGYWGSAMAIGGGRVLVRQSVDSNDALVLFGDGLGGCVDEP